MEVTEVFPGRLMYPGMHALQHVLQQKRITTVLVNSQPSSVMPLTSTPTLKRMEAHVPARAPKTTTGLEAMKMITILTKVMLLYSLKRRWAPIVKTVPVKAVSHNGRRRIDK